MVLLFGDRLSLRTSDQQFCGQVFAGISAALTSFRCIYRRQPRVINTLQLL